MGASILGPEICRWKNFLVNQAPVPSHEGDTSQREDNSIQQLQSDSSLQRNSPVNKTAILRERSECLWLRIPVSAEVSVCVLYGQKMELLHSAMKSRLVQAL